VFTDATRVGIPPEDEGLVMELLAGLHAAFELVGLEDPALRATLALRLSLMLEKRGDVRQGAKVALCAAAAADVFRTAAVDRSRGADDESTRYITAEAIWVGDASLPLGHGRTLSAPQRINGGGGEGGGEGAGVHYGKTVRGGVDGGGASTAVLDFTPSTLSESDQAFACLHADLLVVCFRLQLAAGLLDQREEADRRLARVNHNPKP